MFTVASIIVRPYTPTRDMDSIAEGIGLSMFDSQIHTSNEQRESHEVDAWD